MLNQQEIWKDIDGYGGKYQVSSLGAVRNKLTCRVLKSVCHRTGYIHVSLCSMKELHTKTIHRLVAIAFIPNPENKPQVNHKDGNKKNNSVDNLEWATQFENMRHASRAGLFCQVGTANNNSRLTEKEVLEIRKAFKEGKTQTSLAKIYGVARAQIYKIIHGIRWESIKNAP